jgi:hypothetical protein
LLEAFHIFLPQGKGKEWLNFLSPVGGGGGSGEQLHGGGQAGFRRKCCSKDECNFCNRTEKVVKSLRGVFANAE